MDPVNRHGRSYAGRSGEERAAGRRTALLDAAYEIVGEDGWPALSIAALCKQAGLNKRYFYESFTDLDAAMAALVDKVGREVDDASLGAMGSGGTTEEVLRSGARALVEFMTDDPRRARVLFEAPPTGAVLDQRVASTRRAISLVAARGRTVFPLAGRTGFELPASLIVGGTSQAILDWLEGRIDCSREELIEGLVTMLLAIGEGLSADGRPNT
ncbi:MAG: TetR/AcrR family transcriptional regulator [Solirubrobacteraceae bacterium]|nr:TetR/AcrR family transcriptional regulator [Solirubrobacteraceae bacterium]